LLDLASLSPHGESGLKSLNTSTGKFTLRLSPHGESGLKFGLKTWPIVLFLKSLSTRREWIEIVLIQALSIFNNKSLSTRREWIEIEMKKKILDRKQRLSPHGESGLKFTK